MHYPVLSVDGWFYHNFYPESGYKNGQFTAAPAWSLADKLPRHLWEYGLAHIDVPEPSGWTKGTMLAEDWYDAGGKGNFDHMQFVVGTFELSGRREPQIANESEGKEANYPDDAWYLVRERISHEHPSGWNRVPLVIKYTMANLRELKHSDPGKLYNENGVYQGG
jgi:hypothetical protein